MLLRLLQMLVCNLEFIQLGNCIIPLALYFPEKGNAYPFSRMAVSTLRLPSSRLTTAAVQAGWSPHNIQEIAYLLFLQAKLQLVHICASDFTVVSSSLSSATWVRSTSSSDSPASPVSRNCSVIVSFSPICPLEPFICSINRIVKGFSVYNSPSSFRAVHVTLCRLDACHNCLDVKNDFS